MFNLFRTDLAHLSRREFLSRSGLAALALAGLPVFPRLSREKVLDGDGLETPCQARVLSQGLNLYDRPSLNGKVIRRLDLNQVLPLTGITLGDEEPAYNRFWYELNAEGFAHAGSIQPVETKLNDALTWVSKKGRPVQVTVPFSDVVWNYHEPARVALRLYYGSVSWLSAVAVGNDGQPWYYLSDDPMATLMYYGRPQHFHVFSDEDLSPISPQVPANEKRIEVRLESQLVIAYEYDQPVFMSRAATGAVWGDKIFRTPLGNYTIIYKCPSRHMSHNDSLDENARNLPGVPWVCYITGNGIAFHGTYWHNDYGRPRSHGCINLNLKAAEWIYRWTNPVIPSDERTWLVSSGTRVDVVR